MSDWTRCLAGPAIHETLPDWRPWPSRGTAAGWRRELRPPIAEADLPDSVELVWHGVNDRANLRHFLASPVRGGGCGGPPPPPRGRRGAPPPPVRDRGAPRAGCPAGGTDGR